MANKYVTDEGKTEILKIAFVNDDGYTPFAYLALADSTSSAATTGIQNDFSELSDASYQRVPMTVDSIETKKITLSAIFDENNYNASNPVTVGEIGLCNAKDNSEDTVFFTYCQVPNLEKDATVSLKYTIIISAQ
jgi:hypothetical protein